MADSGSLSKRLIAALLDVFDAADVRSRPLPRSFIQQHAGGDGGVQAFNRAGEGNRNRAVGARGKSAGDTVALVADDECHWAGEVCGVSLLGALRERGKNCQAGAVQAGNALVDFRSDQRHTKDAARRRADGLRIPRAHGSRQADHAGRAKCFSGAQNRAQVAGILKAGENDDQRS